jgi:hypothetical protein
MASTTFVNYQTVIDAGWLNDVNSAVYSGTFQASTITPTNVTSSGAISGATVAGTTSVTTPIVKSGTSLSLQTNGSTTAVTIDTSQKVGIGTTSPSDIIDVQNNQNATTNFYFRNTNTASSASRAYINCISGNVTTKLGSINGDNSYLSFPSGGSQRMYVIDGNSVGVYLQTGNTSWTASSDERLKNITGTYTNALSDIAQIRPVKFTWKSDITNTPQVGVIAQSVQNVVPESVVTNKLPFSTDETEYLGVKYTELIPLMIASIQELSAELIALKTKVGA